MHFQCLQGCLLEGSLHIYSWAACRDAVAQRVPLQYCIMEKGILHTAGHGITTALCVFSHWCLCAESRDRCAMHHALSRLAPKLYVLCC